MRMLAPLFGTAVMLRLASMEAAPPAESVADSPSARWETAIRAFEDADRTAPPAPGGVLFAGSSSIRLWTSLSRDFPGTQVVQRGFGGSQMVDLVAYAERIVLPYRPRMIVVYEGDNDLASGKRPEEILRAYQQLVQLVRQKLPEAQIVFIAVKPSLARWHLADQVRATNRLIEEYSRQDPRLQFADVFTPMLNEKGKPRPELFVEDGLHLNAQGYALWTRVLRPLVNPK